MTLRIPAHRWQPQKEAELIDLHHPPHETLLNPCHVQGINQACHMGERRNPKTLGSRGIFRLVSDGLDKDIKIPPPEIQGYTQTDTVGGRPCKNSGKMVLEQ